MKLLMLYRRRWWLFYLPVLLCSAAAIWCVITQVYPRPPHSVVISGGSADHSYSYLLSLNSTHYSRVYYNDEFCESTVYKSTTKKLDSTCASYELGMIYASSTQLLAVEQQYVLLRYTLFFAILNAICKIQICTLFVTIIIL